MIERNIARIAEAARHVPAGVRAAHPTIPWRQVVAVTTTMRSGDVDVRLEGL